ncbi:hypothetical protein PHYBLDRAFT_153051 [Phycomyces blakesleeanus NRRL 1555(-)]|uniref:Uncharacterized protein n=1 Tax=Phycomyces blakesleeanus (strain ATCC 8743b / DSM 1359 / FGSC 10004 / NBRC 33097 / NRRL 1555) TaxID=763407 RepID=A0A162WA77_PHYB8|nr:hypothetical protein PHYBLDRAFT_153051 [Phycomyces blakesleeanus NRRL 1555(-)]OAD65795.1 hypothetical protein PHYBLDRAFT_153051 [Phycomyces blakesleeanus NRRL 1555(-)]|eukprot:XP_018283835.1 hypothetical protein PHYBLDRAFT_153051 [Phycomyces blakesleeanus NRRL 1555(-)]
MLISWTVKAGSSGVHKAQAYYILPLQIIKRPQNSISHSVLAESPLSVTGYLLFRYMPGLHQSDHDVSSIDTDLGATLDGSEVLTNGPFHRSCAICSWWAI